MARAWARWVEEPLIGGSVSGLAGGTRELGEAAARIQAGLLRSYALAIAAGLAVLPLVFVTAL